MHGKIHSINTRIQDNVVHRRTRTIQSLPDLVTSKNPCLNVLQSNLHVKVLESFTMLLAQLIKSHYLKILLH